MTIEERQTLLDSSESDLHRLSAHHSSGYKNMSFKDLGLKSQLLPTLESMGFTKPTAVQAEAIPVALQDEQDLFVIARTGTGKTAAFGLPLLSLIENSHVPQALILSPTRELANQITGELKRFSKDMPEIKVVSVFGGAPIDRQIQQIKRGVSIIVATPGRLLDLFRRGAVKTEQVKYLVLDEADEMLNMGFKEELDLILERLPEQRRTWLFSATMARGVKRIAERFMSNSEEIRLSSEQAADGVPQGVIEHVAYNIPRGKKYESLLRLVDATEDLFAMVFCRTRLETQSLGDRLMADGIDAGSLHGDLSQALRDQVMGRFKRKQLKLLIATDIASRGIDVDELTHVFHYDLPDNAEAYIHRSGRTGRAGRNGQSAIMVEPRDRRRAENLARGVKLHIKVAPLPKPHDVVKRRLRDWMGELKSVSVPTELPVWLQELEEEYPHLTSLDSRELMLLCCAQAISSTLHRDRLLDLEERGRGAKGRESKAREPRGREAQTREPRGRELRAQESSRARRPVQKDQTERAHQQQRNVVSEASPQEVKKPVLPKAPKPTATETDNKVRWAVIEVSQGSEVGMSESTLRQKLNNGGLQGGQLGRLQVLDQVCIFEVHERGVDQALKSFKGFRIEGQKVRARRRS